MATLNAAVCEDRIKWDHDCEQAMAELRERMRNLPRKMYDPLDLLDDEHCLVMMGNAVETGIGAGLFLVNRGNADDVVPEDMLASTTVLMDLYHKVLDSGQTDGRCSSWRRMRCTAPRRSGGSMCHVLWRNGTGGHAIRLQC